MMKVIVGVIIEADTDGKITPLACQYPIMKETPKTITITSKGRNLSYMDRRSVRHLTQIHKDTLGWVTSELYGKSFYFQAHDVVENSEQLNALFDKVKLATEEELRKRVLVSRQWEQAFMHMHLDMEVK